MTQEINSTILISMSAMTSGGSVVSSMVIFNDPAYTYLALIGAILSLVGIIHEMSHVKEVRTKWSIMTDLLRAFMLGAVLTPMYFMLFLHMGGKIAEQVTGVDGLDGIYNSFWFLLSLLTSWYSPLIWGNFIKKIFKRDLKDKDNE